MRSSTLLALIAAFGPLAVLSSPYYPPEWVEIEIITISPDTARPNHPPGGPATKTHSSHNATITSGTKKVQEVVPDECENEDTSSSTAFATGLANAYNGGSVNSSLPTTLSTVVADKFRRQEDSSAMPPPATLALDKLRHRQVDGSASSTTSMPAGISPPAGIVAGTGAYPTLTTTAGSHKKIKAPCAKGPVKKPVKMKNGETMMMTLTGGLVTALPAAASSSSAADGGPAAMSTSSAAM
ncbi:hypothetical protein JMJ35_006907 [Cladonia borealis]|uniref:Uncharacterized protein n=1 Tax=Cladonia borealis TaxID=184061 RepID=A0AA39QWH7_9LECA|nr:hypothetical protein JMJ35_006907 [Cladonia borealis]